jgi:hypothetical protein
MPLPRMVLQAVGVIAVNLLFVLSYYFDVQLLEGALTASRFVGFHMADLNSALQVMLAIGCALLWLADSPWKAAPASEIWVVDHRTGEWLDARRAQYVPDKVTPMEYALGAQREAAPGSLDFAAAQRHVIEVERRFGLHGVQLLEQLKAQAARRAAASRGGLPGE